MAELVIGDRRVPYRLRRSARALRPRIVVGPDGVEVVAPERLAVRHVQAMVERHAAWIEVRLAKLRAAAASHPGDGRLEAGARLPLRGEAVRLRVLPSERACLTVAIDDGLVVRVPEALEGPERERLIEAALVRFLRERAREDALDAVARYGPPNGLVPRALRIKDQRSLWGSCSAAGAISLSWRLILAPPAILDYVVVHELCHLKEPHHQPPFWRLVASLMPDYARRRAWLRANGGLLRLRAPQPL